MKFYDFDKYEYNALILAVDEMSAKEGYEEIVADIGENEKHLQPRVLNLKKVIDMFTEAEVDGCVSDEEKLERLLEIVYSFANSDEIYEIVLIDSNL